MRMCLSPRCDSFRSFVAVILEHALESPGGLLREGHPRVSDSIGLGGGSRKIDFSKNSQGMLLLV